MERIKGRHLLVLALTLFSLIGLAAAQNFPVKPMRIIVPSTPAGGTDLIARVVGQQLSEIFGQPVVIDNRPGANNNLGTELASKSPADGYTTIVVTASVATSPSLFPKLGYDPIKDFAPITQLASQHYVLVAPLSKPYRSVKDFLAWAKTIDKGVTYATGGVGQMGHLGMELLMSLGRFRGTHVPFKGDNPAIVAVMGGDVDIFMSSMPAGLPHIRSGKVRALAISSPKRSVLTPDLPTIAESGFPGFEVDGWKGFLAPAGTPASVIGRIHDAVVKMFSDQAVRERVIRSGQVPVESSPAEFRKYLKDEVDKWSMTIRKSGIRTD